MNWDDLRIAIAVCQTGSYAAAGTLLRIDETTVSRRLARLQGDLGVPLFEAIDGVRRPTPRCREILRHAEAMAMHADSIADAGADVEGPTGRYRIAATDSVAVQVLGRRTADLLADNPGLTLNFLISTENVNFSRWGADLAVRLRKPDKGDFIISKLADVSLFLFEPKAMSDAGPRELLVGYPDDLDTTPEYQYLESANLIGQARCLTKNNLLVQALIESGRCRGILPGYMSAELLERDDLKVTRLAQTREVWLLLQPHLKDDPGARIVVDWVRDCFAAAENHIH